MFSSLVQSLKWLGFRKSSDFAPIQVPLTNEETMRLPLTNGLIVLKDESWEDFSWAMSNMPF